mmetsp:Transcript_3188/g.4297  ORF Transcript_3188/g.4297 Transcript_3188/m.4297 type:complete len:301 (+) Transcript_3188:62-964(+)|eukprot:CAMPEP_0198138954 /NCGR_PEP_ID=MMETSP1443-20131203/2307_1 /TAXON_ID=186043 /ORGANISM="Entomoneis sp., Strain CCMP2396" /LENGTH=300 /DNA_ID=CAMNT_0043800911 /DNA_START=55 /DNA_END=957 /DNA_ORIENTATION=+
MTITVWRFLCCWILFLLSHQAWGLSVPGGGGDSSSAASFPNLFDRFRVVCPAGVSCITQYDPSIIAGDIDKKKAADSSTIWAAVYRSNNNQPSVFVRDELMQSMRLAVDSAVSSSRSSTFENDLIQTPMSQQKPVAIAGLRPSEEYQDCWVLDSMRCDLKKENMEDSCDGGSEHTEAISAAIDALLLHYLVSKDEHVRFEGAIRTKGTLVSSILLEERGFVEVDSMQKDMVTHVSSLDACLEKYADRIVKTKVPGARERALSIVSYLGRLNREADMKAAQKSSNDNKDDYDPWAGISNIM